MWNENFYFRNDAYKEKIISVNNNNINNVFIINLLMKAKVHGQPGEDWNLQFLLK